MSQAGLNNVAGGGGGIVTTLTPDEGGAVSPVGGNINVFGQTSLTSQVVETHNIADNLTIENRSYITRYVVDASSTIGVQGTYTTIADAISAAVADGAASYPAMATIAIRPGTYNEDLEFTALKAIYLQAIGPEDYTQFPLAVTINGNTTFDSNSIAFFKDITFSAPSGDCVTIGPSASAQSICFQYCTFLSNISITASGGIFNNCYIPLLSLSSNGQGAFYDCSITAAITISDDAIASLTSCFGFSIILSGNGNFQAYYCTLFNGVTGSSAQVPQIYNSGIVGAVDFTGSILYSNINTTAPDNIFSSAVTASQVPTSQGSILQAKRVIIDTTITNKDCYVGVGTTAGGVTMTLPDHLATPDSVLTNQTFIFKDEVGDATANHITIQPQGGATIDGAADYVISSNYGSVTLIFNGSNWNIIA